MELMVVVVILGLLAMFLLPNLVGKSEDAKRKITCIQMKSITQALKMYKIDNSAYPTTQEGLNLLKEKNYFEESKLPKDSWKNSFIYTGSKKSFELISFGADQQEGGEDDIYYSKCLEEK